MMKLQKNSYIKDGEFYFATVGENYVAIDMHLLFEIRQVDQCHKLHKQFSIKTLL
jgi:hypothetical protein